MLVTIDTADAKLLELRTDNGGRSPKIEKMPKAQWIGNYTKDTALYLVVSPTTESTRPSTSHEISSHVTHLRKFSYH